MLDRQFEALVAAASEPDVPGGDDAAVESGSPDGQTSGVESSSPDGQTDGIAFDGLRVVRTAAGFDFETPETTASGLDRAELRDHAADSPYVTNWYFWEWAVQAHDSPRRAFCRKLEGASDHTHDVPARYDALADGLVTEWGQLRIEARLGDHGSRVYEVRHVADADADAAALDSHDDPLDARQIAKTDETGRYRPLKTAPSLARGWLFDDLDWRGVAQTVESFYPATVANWYREQRGELDVDHWRDTVTRMTGIYGVVRTWDRGEGYEHVNWVAEACCDDSQCLKRREWQYDDETDLDVDGGDGQFPCREPCSVVVTAARKWTRLEGEQPQTYEFELTPSEKEQLEAVIDAVADDRTDEIREADVDDGANRYRARFLRAKLFDDEGNLAGVPTNADD
jgi:hypothetical protein